MTDLSSLSTGGPLLLAAVLVLTAGILCDWLASRIHLPDVVLYLVAGLLLAPALAHTSSPGHAGMLQLVLVFGSSYILFDGGMGVRLLVLRDIWITVALIATLGVLVTALVTCAAAHYFLGLPWPVSFLLGVIIAATDPAALIPMFRQIGIRERLAQAVICEAAFNDAVSAVLTFAFLGAAFGAGAVSPGAVALDFVAQASIGLIAGAVVGFLVAFLVGHGRYGFLRDHLPLLTLAAVAGAYVCANRLGGSGFMAVFTAGIVVGNRKSFGLGALPSQGQRVRAYVDTTALLMRMVVFISLGTQMDLRTIGEGLGVVAATIAVFVLVARPLTVFSCALLDRRAKWSTRELLFMCWTRETGIIPGTLAGLLLASDAPYAPQIASVVFSAILFTLLVQGSTTRWLARRLKILES